MVLVITANQTEVLSALFPLRLRALFRLIANFINNMKDLTRPDLQITLMSVTFKPGGRSQERPIKEIYIDESWRSSQFLFMSNGRQTP